MTLFCDHSDDPYQLTKIYTDQKPQSFLHNPQELEDWISGAGEAGFIYVSMGSSVRTASMPASAHRIFVRALGKLPQRVLWKYEAEGNMTQVPPNVMLRRWLPQQDLLGEHSWAIV